MTKNEITKVEKIFFEKIFRNIPFAIIIVDKNHSIIDSNKYFLTLSNYKKEEILTKKIDEIIYKFKNSSYFINKNNETLEIDLEIEKFAHNHNNYHIYFIKQVSISIIEKQLQFKNNIISQCNKSFTIKELQSNILSLIIENIGFLSGGFFTNEHNKFILTHSSNLSFHIENKIRLQNSESFFFSKTKDILIINKKDIENSDYSNFLFNIQTIASIPIINSESVLGYIILFDEGNKMLSHNDRNLLLTISEEIGERLNKILNEVIIKNSEIKYKNLVETTDDIVWTINDFMIFSFVNNKISTILGYSEDEILGSSFYKLIPLNVHLKIKNIFKENEITYSKLEFETYLFKKDRGILNFQINAYPEFDENKKFLGYLGTFRDITEIRNIEDIKKSKEISERMIELKQDFFSSISHDIRTPLNSIVGHTDFLNSKNDNSDIQIHINAIKTSSNALLRIVNDILDLSKIEYGKFSIQFEAINLKLFVEEIVSIFEYQIENKNLEFIININSQYNIFYLDEIRIKQVIFNLISNSIKFTAEGFIKIDIEIIENKDKSGDLIIKIIDSGEGIPDDLVPYIWEQYTQKENLSNRKYGGWGLGLYICKKIVELMNGTITLECNNNYTQFKIIIPTIKIENIDSDFYKTNHNLLNIDFFKDELNYQLSENKNSITQSLENIKNDYWLVAKQSNSIEDYKTFQEKIDNLAIEKNIDYLKNYSYEFAKYLKVFDIKVITKYFYYYPNIINFIKELK